MRLWCKLSYEAEFDADEYIAEHLKDGDTEKEAMQSFRRRIEEDIFYSIDTRVDNKFYVPYDRKLETKWRKKGG